MMMSLSREEPAASTSRGRSGRTPVALTIAGSDSGGGAGVAADLKAFARCGVHGALAITAVTAQNTVGVGAIHEIPHDVILGQIRLVAGDLGLDAVKVGMLGGEQAARAVAEGLEVIGSDVPVVVDPVLSSSSSTPLLTPDAFRILVSDIIPRAAVITPNLEEARTLAGTAGRPELERVDIDPQRPVRDEPDRDELMRELLEALLGLGPACVVLTGGHTPRAVSAPAAVPAEGSEPVVDLFAQAGAGHVVELTGERRADGADHGSGCTHSALLAAQLALGREPLEAARRARELTGLAIAGGLREIGAGTGPVDVLGIARLRATELGDS